MARGLLKGPPGRRRAVGLRRLAMVLNFPFLTSGRDLLTF
jgi:hypothetical protein